MTYEVIRDRENPADWRVEGIDHDSEGECYLAIFCGPDAEREARIRADFMNKRPQSSPAASRPAV